MLFNIIMLCNFIGGLIAVGFAIHLRSALWGVVAAFGLFLAMFLGIDRAAELRFDSFVEQMSTYDASIN